MQRVLVAPGARPFSELAGKTAVITGSTSGIGLGIAKAFAAAGMNVVLNGLGDAALRWRRRGQHRGGIRRESEVTQRGYVQAGRYPA